MLNILFTLTLAMAGEISYINGSSPQRNLIQRLSGVPAAKEIKLHKIEILKIGVEKEIQYKPSHFKSLNYTQIKPSDLKPVAPYFYPIFNTDQLTPIEFTPVSGITLAPIKTHQRELLPFSPIIESPVSLVSEKSLLRIKAEIFEKKHQAYEIAFGLYLKINHPSAVQVAKQWLQLTISPDFITKTLPSKEIKTVISKSPVRESLRLYKKGDLKKALLALEPIDNHLKQITKARILTQMENYPKALLLYKEIGPQSPFWVDSLVEKGWVQILIGNDAEAIGNMYSLQGFDNVLIVDRPLIQAIGYLNLCQYGDALNTVEKALSQNQNLRSLVSLPPKNLYSMVKNFIKKPKHSKQSSVLLELSRSPRFLTIQREINQIETERDQLTSISRKLMQMEKKSKSMPEIRIARVEVQKHRRALFKYLNKKQKNLLVTANRTLKVLLGQLKNDLNHQFQQLEFIKFEIYEKAGDHIRLKASGVQLGENTNPKSQRDSMQWDFDGEIWEDEIGNFRTALKSQCRSISQNNTELKPGSH